APRSTTRARVTPAGALAWSAYVRDVIPSRTFRWTWTWSEPGYGTTPPRRRQMIYRSPLRCRLPPYESPPHSAPLRSLRCRLLPYSGPTGSAASAAAVADLWQPPPGARPARAGGAPRGPRP